MNKESDLDDVEEKNVVIYIDKRVLIRDCLSRCLLSSDHDDEVVSLSSVEDCLAACIQAETVVAILYGVAQALDEEADVDEDLDRLAAAFPAVPLMVLSDFDTTDHVLRAIKTGVRGYISTNTSLEVAIGATHIVQAGGSFVPEGCLAALRLERDDDAVSLPEPEAFTPRQIEVLKRLRQGKLNRVIALELGISESRVKAHIRNLMQKLNATNRTQVAFLTRHMFARTRRGTRLAIEADCEQIGR